MRVFIAVRVAPLPGLTRVIEELGRLGRSLKPVDPQQLHLTLKFLGEIGEADAAALASRLSRALAGAGPAQAQIVGLGAFPRVERPSVVWAGVEQPKGLSELARQVETECVGAGFPAEARDWAPHVTLARVRFRPPPELLELLAEHAETRFGSETFDAVEVLESVTGRSGPQYVPLATIPLESA